MTRSHDDGSDNPTAATDTTATSINSELTPVRNDLRSALMHRQIALMNTSSPHLRSDDYGADSASNTAHTNTVEALSTGHLLTTEILSEGHNQKKRKRLHLSAFVQWKGQCATSVHNCATTRDHNMDSDRATRGSECVCVLPSVSEGERRVWAFQLTLHALCRRSACHPL